MMFLLKSLQIIEFGMSGHPWTSCFFLNQNSRNNIKRDHEMRKTQNNNKRKGVIFPVASSKSEMPDSYADF